MSSVEQQQPGIGMYRVYDLVGGAAPSLTSVPVGLYEATGPYPTACQDYWATITGVTDLVKPAAGDRKYAITAWYPTTATSGRRARYLTETSNDTAMATANAAVYSGLSSTLIPPMAAKLVNSYLNAPIRTDLGQMPVLIFSPGRVVAREMGSALCEEMASHGYIVLALGHTYEAPSVEFPSSLEGNITYTNTTTEYNNMMRQRIADARHLLANLSTLLGNGIYQQMDLANIGAFGHSYGGYLAGELAYVEPTLIKAAMNHDGSPGRTGNDNFAATNGFAAPYFFLSTDDNSRSDPHWAPMKALLTGDVYDVKANGTRHYSFMDTCTLVPAGSKALYCGSVTPVRGIEIGRAYTLAFFNHYLKGTTETLLAGASGSFPEIQFF
ncbi:alpha/beta hydrolase family protein [Antrihabitans spumae]|uniref:Alpha/beta hydrolase family protein n=1 Tax=Antrihabitans spumae TaxID=3373370 RepID=A0ABW7KKR6_9NOCA